MQTVCINWFHVALSVFGSQVLHQTFPQHTFLMNGLIHGVKVRQQHTQTQYSVVTNHDAKTDSCVHVGNLLLLLQHPNTKPYPCAMTTFVFTVGFFSYSLQQKHN